MSSPDTELSPELLPKQSSEQLENPYPAIKPAGDSAALIEFGNSLELDVNASVLAFDQRLMQEKIQGVTEISPALVTLLVRFDPAQTSYNALCTRLRALLDSNHEQGCSSVAEFARWKIPALYGAEAGSDLNEIADLLNLSVADTIEQHSTTVQRVLTLGFAPGCAYLGLLPEHWNLPRLKVIKPQVPAGSILVAVRQTVMTSAAMPTGWRSIACTPLNNFNIERAEPVLVKHGDEVQYQPVSQKEFNRLIELQSQGQSVIERVL